MITKDHLGVDYGTEEALCKEYGISRSCLYQRLNTLKWNLDKALTTPVRSKSISPAKETSPKKRKGTIHYIEKPFYVKSCFPSREYIRYLKNKIAELEFTLKDFKMRSEQSEVEKAIRSRIIDYQAKIEAADTFFYAALDVYVTGGVDALNSMCDENTSAQVMAMYNRPDALTEEIYKVFAEMYKVLSF